MEDAKSKLEQLTARVSGGDIGTARLWRWQRVIISASKPPPSAPRWYPEPRWVVTAYAAQLSWLFVQLRDIFSPYYNHQTKIEFFGRLGNAALRYKARNQGAEVLGELLIAVLHEAFAIADEMEEGSFRSLALAVGNEIVDDHIDEAERRGFVGIEETRRFFAEKGVGT